jgi:type VI protein secretion system component VasK
MSANFVIGVDGQTLAYTVGQAARVADLQWTGASGQARIEFLPPTAAAQRNERNRSLGLVQNSRSGPDSAHRLPDNSE